MKNLILFITSLYYLTPIYANDEFDNLGQCEIAIRADELRASQLRAQWPREYLIYFETQKDIPVSFDYNQFSDFTDQEVSEKIDRLLSQKIIYALNKFEARLQDEGFDETEFYKILFVQIGQTYRSQPAVGNPFLSSSLFPLALRGFGKHYTHEVIFDFYLKIFSQKKITGSLVKNIKNVYELERITEHILSYGDLHYLQSYEFTGKNWDYVPTQNTFIPVNLKALVSIFNSFIADWKVQAKDLTSSEQSVLIELEKRMQIRNDSIRNSLN